MFVAGSLTAAQQVVALLGAVVPRNAGDVRTWTPEGSSLRFEDDGPAGTRKVSCDSSLGWVALGTLDMKPAPDEAFGASTALPAHQAKTPTTGFAAGDRPKTFRLEGRPRVDLSELNKYVQPEAPPLSSSTRSLATDVPRAGAMTATQYEVPAQPKEVWEELGLAEESFRRITTEVETRFKSRQGPDFGAGECDNAATMLEQLLLEANPALEGKLHRVEMLSGRGTLLHSFLVLGETLNSGQIIDPTAGQLPHPTTGTFGATAKFWTS